MFMLLINDIFFQWTVTPFAGKKLSGERPAHKLICSDFIIDIWLGKINPPLLREG